jgi:two-component system response regulator YesN
MYRALLVDDEPWALAGLRKIFKRHEKQFEISGETTNSVEALGLIRRQKPDAVFTDIRMPEISGIELMKLIRGEGLDTEFIIISGFAEFSYAQESLRLGAFDYRLKPLQLKEADALLNSLWRHLENRRNAGKEPPEDPGEDRAGMGEYINPDFRKLLAYINAHYQKELRLSELAEKFRLNPTYCSELFKKITHKTYSEYLSELRIEQARRFLDSTAMGLEEIACKVGFSDYYYFNKVFKKITGLPPLRYRKEKLLRGEK